MSKIKFNTLDELYYDIDSETLLNVDLVKPLCDMSNPDFIKFFYLINKECGFCTCEGFYVEKETVLKVIENIKYEKEKFKSFLKKRRLE